MFVYIFLESLKLNEAEVWFNATVWCLLTCLANRAIHLEVAFTFTPINALHRFVARKSQLKITSSHNGTNLVGAERKLQSQIRTWKQSTIGQATLQKTIDCNFNLPAASHSGEVRECQIWTIRKILCNQLKEQLLNNEALQVFLRG